MIIFLTVTILFSAPTHAGPRPTSSIEQSIIARLDHVADQHVWGSPELRHSTRTIGLLTDAFVTAVTQDQPNMHTIGRVLAAELLRWTSHVPLNLGTDESTLVLQIAINLTQALMIGFDDQDLSAGEALTLRGALNEPLAEASDDLKTLATLRGQLSLAARIVATAKELEHHVESSCAKYLTGEGDD